MATWNEWFVSAKEKNFDLKKYLKVDQQNDLERLYSSGLPCFELLLLNGTEVNSKKVENFITKHKMIWTRVVNSKEGKRQSKLGIKSFEEFIEFFNSLPFKQEDCSIQLYQMKKNYLGGNIIASENSANIEIAFGTQNIVGKSTQTFFHGKVNDLGRLEFFEKNTPDEIIRAANKALNYLKKSKGEFLKGYFEFILTLEFEVFFLDYKTSFE